MPGKRATQWLHAAASAARTAQLGPGPGTGLQQAQRGLACCYPPTRLPLPLCTPVLPPPLPCCPALSCHAMPCHAMPPLWLQVAVRYELCRPSTAAITLQDLLALHLRQASRDGRVHSPPCARLLAPGAIKPGALLAPIAQVLLAPITPVLLAPALCTSAAAPAVSVGGGACCTPRPPRQAAPLSRKMAPPERALVCALQGWEMGLGSPADAAPLAEVLSRFMSRRAYQAGDTLWRLGEPSDHLYYIEQGAVQVEQRYHEQLLAADKAVAAGEGEGMGAEDSVHAGSAEGTMHAGSAARASGVMAEGLDLGPGAGCAGGSGGAGAGGAGATRLFEFGPGTLVGAIDFYLNQPHTSTAVCLSPACRLLALPRGALRTMAAEAPQALHVWQMVVLRAKYIDLTAALQLS